MKKLLAGLMFFAASTSFAGVGMAGGEQEWQCSVWEGGEQVYASVTEAHTIIGTHGQAITLCDAIVAALEAAESRNVKFEVTIDPAY